jgi:hypothetical protein
VTLRYCDYTCGVVCCMCCVVLCVAMRCVAVIRALDIIIINISVIIIS